MLPNNVSTIIEAPTCFDSISAMQTAAFQLIMELTEDEKVSVLSKYAEKYGRTLV